MGLIYSGVFTRQQQERFLEKTQAIPWSGCWIWTAFVDKRTGYGRFYDVEAHKPENAHKVSYRLFRGPVGLGKHVCHTCDIRCCVNPQHLFLGTNQDNILDSVAKGRRKRKQEYGDKRRKLTPYQAGLCAARLKSGDSLRGLAREFGCCSHTIKSAVKRWIA